MFLKLKDLDSIHPILIRVDQIIAVYFDNDEGCTCVDLLNGDSFYVSSSVENILDLLDIVENC